jgi:hypothetical protein
MLMNASGQWRGHIERIYWAVSPTVLEGVVMVHPNPDQKDPEDRREVNPPIEVESAMW